MINLYHYSLAYVEIDPEDSGCTFNEQCNSVWPGAYCSNGQCRCKNNQPAYQTNYGKICLTQGHCPTNGQNSKFLGSGGHVPDSCEDYTACVQGYECICNNTNANCLNDGVDRFCCPMKGI